MTMVMLFQVWRLSLVPGAIKRSGKIVGRFFETFTVEENDLTSFCIDQSLFFKLRQQADHGLRCCANNIGKVLTCEQD